MAISIQTATADLTYLAMTPEAIIIMASHAINLASLIGVTVSTTLYGPMKLSIQPMINANKNTAWRMFGNGSTQAE